MMTNYSARDPESDAQHAAELWSFLAPQQPPAAADAIFVFGGVNLRVPERAAELYAAGFAGTVLVSGGAGSRTHLHFDQAEADVFVEVLRRQGVPACDIICERAASNTGENVEFGMTKLRDEVPAVSSLLLVAAPFIMRRCLATFERQYPTVHVIPCPPVGAYEDFVDRPYEDFVDRLVAEVDRLDAYADAGFITPVEIPTSVRLACAHFRSGRG
jgi:uncharacterized SAM-binding protein YcdF (DUF218 family)